MVHSFRVCHWCIFDNISTFIRQFSGLRTLLSIAGMSDSLGLFNFFEARWKYIRGDGSSTAELVSHTYVVSNDDSTRYHSPSDALSWPWIQLSSVWSGLHHSCSGTQTLLGLGVFHLFAGNTDLFNQACFTLQMFPCSMSHTIYLPQGRLWSRITLLTFGSSLLRLETNIYTLLPTIRKFPTNGHKPYNISAAVLASYVVVPVIF